MPEDKQAKIVKLRGKRWKLPEVLHFEPGAVFPGRVYFYEVLDFRPPLAGEHYVSGASPAAYRTYNDLSTPHLVVKPTHKAIRVSRWARGERV